MCCGRFLAKNQGVQECLVQYSQLTFPGCKIDVLMSVSRVNDEKSVANTLPLTGWKLFLGGVHCGVRKILKVRGPICHGDPKVLIKPQAQSFINSKHKL
jgi:hypothetical protein